MASEIDKPGGLVVIEKDQVLDFLAPLPVRSLWGVGVKLAEKLKKHNIVTIEELRSFSELDLIELYGSYGRTLFQMALGQDHRTLCQSRESKSLGAERTFSSNILDLKELERYLFGISLEVAKRAKSKKIWAKTITLKYKNQDFESRTKSKTLKNYIQTEDEIFKHTNALLCELPLTSPLRLLGVSLSNFQKAKAEIKQLSLF